MRRFVALCLIGFFLAMPFVVAEDSMGPYSSSATVTASGGRVVVRVQYLDGYPRSNAYVKIYHPVQGFVGLVGRTNETGYVQKDDMNLLPNTLYKTNATYPDGAILFGYNNFITDTDGGASVTITRNSEITPPAITILSPENQTYDGRLVPLSFTLNDYSPISWMGYSLDGQANTTVTGNVTLNVGAGSHSMVVYANDTGGNMGSSGTVYFSSLGGCVVVRVQYLDGAPRSGADVAIVSPSIYLGITDEDGEMTIYDHGLSEGDYSVKALFSGSQFGPNTYLHVDGNGDGSATITNWNLEITPPALGILSPQSQTYTSNTVPLTYAVNDFSPISWTGYSLDGQPNMTMTGNTTLNISFGTQIHSIIVFSNDTFGNMGQSGTVYFAVQRNSCIVRVQYLDGTPRPGAAVWIINGNPIGITDSNGEVNCDFLSPGGLNIRAIYPPGSQFGPNTFLHVPEGTTIIADYEITPPAITILSPQNLTYFNSSVPLTFTVYDYSPVSWMGYSLDSGANVTVSGNTTLTLADGSHQVAVYANDTFGNMGSSGATYFAVDTSPPAITILSPQNQTYYNSSVPLSFTIYDYSPISWIGYSLDKQANTTITGNTIISVEDGAHGIVVYANDTFGNMGSSQMVCFTANSSLYEPWETSFIGLDSYPIVDFAVYNGSLYAAADNKLYAYDGSSWNVIDAPTFVTSLEPYGGKLVVGGQGGLYCYDGTSFSLIFSVPTYIKALGAYNDTLYAGAMLDNPPELYYCNGPPENPVNWHVDTGFSTILNFSGAFGSIDSFAVYDGKMYVASGNTVYCFDGTGWSVALSYEYAYAFLDMQVYNGKLYLATRDLNRIPLYMGGTGFSGTLIEYDGGNWTTILGHDYWLYSLEVYDGKLYVGTANRIYTYNGTAWDVSFYAENGAFYAISMITYNDKIYAGIGNGYIFADPAPAKANPETIVVPEFHQT